MRRQFENLARVTHAWAEDQHPREQAPEWLVLERAMRRRSRAVARRRVLGGAALGVAAAAAAVLFLRGVPRSERGLSFVVSGAEPGLAQGQLRSGLAPVRVTFSDGSDVMLQPGARGRVLGTTAAGARLELQAGRARFAITHRPRTEWSVAAGPFTVVVHGTVFEVGWTADTGALEVGLISGSVSVRGPVAAGAIVMRAGQRLTAHASTHETRIDRLADPVAASLGGPSQPPGRTPPAGPEGQGPEAASGERPAGGARVPGPRGGAGARAAGRAAGAAAVREVSASWAARVASGAFKGVVEDAEALGVERCLAQVSAPALAALADAARYGRRTELARRALLAERRRFGGTAAAHDAAFLLGRLADDSAGDAREALRWYDRYLAEAGQGTYGAEALGRRMLALERLGRREEARAAARAYLEAFRDGPHAARAARLRATR